MKKLRIDLDALSVESFETSQPAPDAEGTVRGQESDPTRWQLSCFCTYPTSAAEKADAVACG